MRSLSEKLFWPVYKIIGDSPPSALVGDPAFRSSLVAAAAAMLVLAASLVLRQVKPDQTSNRTLTTVSLMSAAAALLAFLVGALASA